MKKVKIKIIVTAITFMMIIAQLPTDALVYAKTNTMFDVELIAGDMYSQKIEVKNIEEGITKVALQSDGKTIETKDVSETLSFDVHTNGTYDIIGYDETGAQKSEESIKVKSFEDLTIEEDTKTHQVKIVSRYHLTEKIKINDKESVDAIETNTGVYEAYYDLPKNGEYTFVVLNFDGEVIGTQTKKFSDVPNVNKAGEIILSSEDDVKQIITNPSGTFIMDADIILTSDLLKEVHFTGILDGKGYTISGITDRLFNSISNATIKNIVIEGRLSETSTNSTITDSGFYVEAEDHDKNFALIMNSDNTIINNSFVLANIEGKTVSGFILEGTGSISNSYVSGYLSGNEVYGFGKDVDVKNSYITASLSGKERTLFSNGKREDCFYDAQINDLEDTEASPYYTKDMISGKLKKEAFSETEGTYPEIKAIKDFKEQAKAVSTLSVISVKTESNLSALEDKVETKEIENIEWNKVGFQISAESNDLVNRFALKTAEKGIAISAGESTTSKTTQITYPTTAGTYYKIVKSNETAPTLPTSHSQAITEGWKIVYWSGSNKATGLEWNTEYTVYSTNLKEVTLDGTMKTKYGKNGGKIALEGKYDVGETMTATLSGVNTTKGTFYWETASTLDATSWDNVKTSTHAGSQDSDTYIVKESEDAKYLRVRFVADDTTGYKGEVTASTKNIIKQALKSVTIENKTTTDGSFTLNDQLTAHIDPSGKELDVDFTWHHGGSTEVIATGRNYKIKASDVGKQIYVKAAAKNDGELKGEVSSTLTSNVLAIQCNQPTATDTLKKISQDDLTVTLTMDTDKGVYRYGYKENGIGEIIPYSVLARNKTNATVTGLKASTTYYFYVQEVGENGYSDSAWSSDYIEVKTDNDYVKGDIVITGDTIYNQKLTASIINAPENQTGKYVWYRLDKDGVRGTTPLAEDTTTYTLTKEDVKFKIEVVYQGTGDYSGEVSNITDSIAKEEKTAPATNLTVSKHDDTSITVNLPTNNDGEKYIIGISNTKDGVPIEQLDENNELLTFGSGDTYPIEGLSRDTEYFLFIRYAENDIHQKSEWINAENSISQRTDKKTFTGTIEFTYEVKSGELMQGQKIKATLKPDDTSFNYKGIWKWFSIDKDGKETEINNFEINNDKQGTSYIVPDNEAIGTTYKVTFEANVGYSGTINNTSAAVTETVKTKYETPDSNKIVMEAIDDTSFKVMMSDGEGKYRFWYKEADNNPWDSFVGFLNKTFIDSNDGYKEIEVKGDTGKDVYSNVDVVIEGLKRNTKYIVRVQRVGDDKGTTSDFAYSTDATKEEDQSVTTKKTEIAGHVTIDGTIRYGETLTATYNEATYGSTGSGNDSDQDGTYQWYRGNTKIDGATFVTYKLNKEDIGEVISVKYTMPENNDFTGSTDNITSTVKQALCVNPQVTEIKEVQDVSGNTILEVTGNASQNEEHIYYRLQKAEKDAPKFPINTEELNRDWKPVERTTIQIATDTDGSKLAPNTKYTLYVIKEETETHEASSVLSENYTMGLLKQGGIVELSGDVIVGKTVTATLSDYNNNQGTWKWYMSKDTYNGSTMTKMPSENDKEAWEEITSGYSSPKISTESELNITENLFAHYIRVEFVANEDKNYQGVVHSTDEKYVQKIYEETVTITSTTEDGNKKPKAYANSVITGTINDYVEKGNIDRDIVQFKIGESTYIYGSELIIDKNGKFTYTMPNDDTFKSMDGKEITAEISTPKIIGLYVDKGLKPLTEQTINSKDSTKTFLNYTYGIPISNTDDLKKFMTASDEYSSATETYVITSNLNMSLESKVEASQLRGAQDKEAFQGTLNGDYHTISNLKNELMFWMKGKSSSDYSVVKNIVLVNSNVNSDYSFESQGSFKNAGVIADNVIGYVRFENLFLIDSNLSSSFDTGYIFGRAEDYGSNSYAQIISCGSVGGTITTPSAGGGLGGNIGNAQVSDCYNIGTKIVGRDATGVGYAVSPTIKNFYTASQLQGTNIYAAARATKGTYSNIAIDKTITPNYTKFPSGLLEYQTSQMIGNGLANKFGNEKWTFANGYYPRLIWMGNNSIANLYAATRGAFVSVDNATSSDDMFNGNIFGPIQIPTELQTSNYSIKSNDENILKVTDSGMIIPVGNVDDKTTITITYTEPNETIGGTASNTYEFTVKQQVQSMSEVSIVDENGSALQSNPQMNQTLKVKSTEGTSYQWYKRKSGSTESEIIKNATSSTYTVKASDIGYELCVLVEADGYASTYSSYTKAATSIKPDAPIITEVTDSSVKLAVNNGETGLKYEFGYMRGDQNASIILVENKQVDKDGSVTLSNLQRNKLYHFFVRVAAATDGSYEASDWSEATNQLLEKTSVSSNVQFGTGINSGKTMNVWIESVNGQTGTWQLDRIKANSEDVIQADIASSDINSFDYTLTDADVGFRIKAIYTGTGDFKGNLSAISDVVKRTYTDRPSTPIEVSKTDSSLVVKMETAGIYDIGYAETATGSVKEIKENVSGLTNIVFNNLDRNKEYYILSRASATDSSEESQWSNPLKLTTNKTEIADKSIVVEGTLQVDETVIFKAPTLENLTGTWKLERQVSKGTTTTISPSTYTVDNTNNTVTYQLDPKDAGATIKVTFTGTGDYKDSIHVVTTSIQNAKLDTKNMPSGLTVSSIKDYSLAVGANDGADIYQYGYAKKGTSDITAEEATGNAGTAITLNGLARNTTYDLYVRKASKTGYDASDWVKLDTKATEKSALTGTVEYVKVVDGVEKPATVGVADIGVTYKAKYQKGTYDQTGDDSNAGTWQWYANDVAIENATSDTYTIQPMEGEVEITVKYIANDDSNFKESRTASIGTLTKPAYDAPSQLPTVTAPVEDGQSGSQLEIKSTIVDHVFYYVQEASNATVPTTILSSIAEKNEAKAGQWFKATEDVTLNVKANTEYVVYVARLEDGEHQSSGVISQRAVKTVKENLSHANNTLTIKETDNTNWKVLQDKELRINDNGKAIDGVWQYYVTTTPDVAETWANITSEIKDNTTEGKTETFSYTKVNIPLKYANGYYVRAVFTGRGDYEGSKTYTSTEALIGTQIQGHVEITQGDTTQVFVPIEVNYIYAKNANGTAIEDEANGIWTWYREANDGTYEKIIREKDTVGLKDQYIPTADDVDKKIYAVYTGALDGIYSGSVESNKLDNVKRSKQATPSDITVKQVNGTSIQVVLPTNMDTQGKTIAQPRLEYTIKDKNDWKQNGVGEAWIYDLKANTEYEVRVLFEGTSEYEPSDYGTVIIVTTGNQSFDEDNLAIKIYDEKQEETTDLKPKSKITATFTGSGYDEGDFIVKRSDGTKIEIIESKVEGTIKKRTLFTSGTNTIEYEVQSADIGSNIIIQYQAKKGASTYGGSIEKSTEVVAKPTNPTQAGTPVLETIKYSETTLKVKVNDANEYVFNESSNVPLESDWQKLKADEAVEGEESGYHTFTGLDKNKSYYLHARTAETAYFSCSTEDISAATKPWARTQYKITYENMEGATNGNPVNPSQYTELSDEITLNDASKAGWTFTGWTTDGVTTPTKGLTIPTHSSGNKTFTANWEKITYNLTYELNGGTASPVNPATFDVESADFTLTNPTKKGYKFLGWSGTGITGRLETVTIHMGEIEDRSYTANWEIIDYDISYNLNGGTNGSGNPATYTVETETFSLAEPTRDGYTFEGWSGTDITGTSKTVTIEKDSIGEREYTANWKTITYDITYDLDGGSVSPDNKTTYTIETTDFTLTNPTKRGYKFLGWSEGSSSETKETVTIAKGATGDKKYTAHWEENIYTITYVLNGGTNGQGNPASYKVSDNDIKLVAPTKKGYTFEGWTFEGRDEPIKNVTIAKDSIGNKTYTANWSKDTYDIIYHLGGGTNATSNPATYDVETDTFTLAEPTRTGYTFEGWSGTDIEDTSKDVTITKDSIGNREYTAKWKTITYDITYDLDGGSVSPENKTTYTIETTDFTLINPTKIGYTFSGWSEGSSSDKKETVTVAKGTTGNKKFTANWTINSYIATFDVNGGESVTPPSITKNYKEALGALPTAKKTGYRLEGWYTEKTGGDKITVDTTMPAGHITYYAHWEIETYAITYDLTDKDAVNGEGNPETYTVEDVDIVLHAPVWTGHTFLGWSYEGMKDSTKPELTVTITKGSTGDKKFTANWEMSKYTVKFDFKNGNDVLDMGATHGIPIVEPEKPSKTGYTFKGWYTSETYEKAWNFDDVITDNMTLYAKWEINHYDVTFNTNDGSVVDKQTIDHGQKVAKPVDPTKEHYEFAGWYSDDKLTKKYDFDNAVESAMTLYAKWIPKKYTITYVLDGGSESENPSTYTVEDKVTLKAPTKENYTFKGWTFEGQVEPIKDVTINVGEHGNKTYTANWEINHYDVTFNTNGGGTINKQTIDHGSQVTKPTNPTKEGYTFEKWYSDDKLTKEYDFDKAVESTMTLYAKWTINQYTATFNGNGGESVTPTTITKNYKETLGELPTASRIGYTFNGWFTEAEDGTKITKDTTMPLDGATYYAQWTINQYTAKFDGNGGSNGTDIKVDYNAKLGTLPTSTRVGHTFNGWFTEKTEGTKIDENTLMPVDGAIYYAQWTVNPYTATFKSNDNESDDQTITKNYQAELETLPTPVARTGYDFSGWFTAKTGGEKISATTKMPVDGATYYAQWTPHAYKIEYDLNDGGTGKATNDSANKATYTIEDGDITLKAPSWKNYVFIGWSYEGMSDPDAYEMSVTISAGSTGNKKYTANWRMSAHTVTFDSKGGSDVEDQGVDDNGLVPEPSAPTKEGYTFDGWYTKDDAKWNFERDTVTDDITLYAKWTINEYTATFHANGGESVSPETITKNYKEALGELPTASRIGYTFIGWFTKADDTGKEITKDTTMPLNGTTYYAHWKVNAYTVTFDSNGGTKVDEIKKDYNTKLGTLPTPTREGYTFVGWFTELENGTEITKDTLMPVDGATYYAHWTIKKYTVKFETNGDSVIDPITVEHGKTFEMPENPTKDMFKFIGWYTDKELENKYDSDSVVIKDIILYAKYEEVVSGNADIKIDKDSPIQLGNKQEEIIEAVLDENEYRDYLYGKDVSIRIECEAIKEDERDIVKEALDGRTSAKYYDITIYKTIDDVEIQVDKLRKVIKIVLDIPEELYPENGVTRVFDVIRIHKETAEILSDLDKDEKTVTIESDEFSTYVLCYKDSKEAETDTPVIAPADKVEGIIKNPTTTIPSQTPSTDDESTPKDEENKLPDADKQEEKEAEKNIMYYFLIPIGVLLAGCIGMILKLKKRKK